ncbi:MAG: hypothetical protein QOF35_469 [Actinomycetota bacterium]|nr:hypothetical protein [Actinomycetota bacterium]
MTVLGWCLPDEEHEKASLMTDTGPQAHERVLCRRTGLTYRVGKQLSRTERSIVYAVESDSPPLAFKRYTPATLQDERHLEARLWAMVSRPPAYRAAESTHVWCAWPEDLAIVEGRLAGYVMSRIDTADAVTLPALVHGGDPPRPRKEGGCAGWTWADRVLVAADLARTVALLHDSDVIVGDLRGPDVLVTSDRRVTLLGCDSMQVTDRARGRTYPCRSDPYPLAPPELLVASGMTTLRPRSADLFSLAVAVHLVLLDGQHPFDGQWRGHGTMPPAGRLAQSGLWCHAGDERLRPHPDGIALAVLPDVLQQYFRMAFVDGARHPYDRPSARQWSAELDRLHNCLTGPARSPAREVPVRVTSAPPPHPPVRTSTMWVHQASSVGSPNSTLRDLDSPAVTPRRPVAGTPATDGGSAPQAESSSAPLRRGRPAMLRLGAWTAVAALCAGGVGTAWELQTTAAGPSASSVTASTPTPSAPPSPAARPDSPAQALEQIHKQDAPDAEGLADSWVAQLATQPVVPSAPDDAALSAILDGHRALQQRYPDALLLWSTDWNYNGTSWITILGRRFATAQEANAWCDAQRLEPRRCFAKRLSRTGPVNGTVRYRG